MFHPDKPDRVKHICASEKYSSELLIMYFCLTKEDVATLHISYKQTPEFQI